MKKSYKRKAFTLIELVFSLALIFIVISLLLKSMSASLKTSEVIKKKDDLFSQSYFACNYMYNEISSTDYIISNGNKNSLGFTLIKLEGKDKNGKNSKYNYTYYSHSGKNIRRHSINTDKKIKNNIINMKMGVNNLISGVESVDSSYSKNLITIKINFDDNTSKILKIANRTFEEFK